MSQTDRQHNLRKLDGGEAMHLRADQGMTFILVKANGDVRYGHGRTDKDHIVAEYIEGQDLLMLVWTGTYRSDVFMLTRADLDKRYA